MKAIHAPIQCEIITYDAPMEYLVLVFDEICVYRDHVKPDELTTILGADLKAQLMASVAPMKYSDAYFKLEGNFMVGALDHPAYKLELLRKAVLLCGQLTEVQFQLATLLDGAKEPLAKLDGARIALMMEHIDPLIGNFETISDVTDEALTPLISDWTKRFGNQRVQQMLGHNEPEPDVQFICTCRNGEI